MKTWLIADPHFFHKGMCVFTRYDGSKLRPWDDVHKMTFDMMALWNETVAPNDKVYCLGDMVFKSQHLYIFDQLHGRKVLIKGNHDNLKLSQYQKYFYDVRAYHVLDRILLSHIPIHPESLSRYRGNVHGHLHYNKLNDPRYLCVSVEHTDYKPVDFQKVRDYYEDLGRSMGDVKKDRQPHLSGDNTGYPGAGNAD